MREDEERKLKKFKQLEEQNRRDYWLCPEIVVRVTNREIANSKGILLHNSKGIVKRVIDRYGGEIELYDGTIVQLDQQDLETVIPKVGGLVKILNGAGRGATASLVKINEADYNCDLRIHDGPLANSELKVAYEDFSKLAS
jgi:DNA/RNA-binding protein KIN17